MVSPVNSRSPGVIQAPVQPTTAQRDASGSTETARVGQAPKDDGPGVVQAPTAAEPINTDHYSTGSGTDAEVSGNLVRESAAARTRLQRPLARGIDDAEGARAAPEDAEITGTAVPRPLSADQIAARYGVAGTALDGKIVGMVHDGKQVPAALAQAKWAELRAAGFDPTKFDAAGYLQEHPDVAAYYRTNSGLIDPNLAAAMHHVGWGRHEMRGEGAATVDRPDAVNAASGPTVDFNKLTQDQQYDYLKNKTVADAGGDPTAWKSGDREINVIGVRGFADGKLNANEPDQYNDTIYVCRVVDGKKEVHAFSGSVDAGIYDAAEHDGFSLSNQDGVNRGVAHVADGFMRDAFTRGPVTGGVEGLRQTGWVRVNADFNNNGKIDDSERLGRADEGMLAGTKLNLQFHPGTGDRVGANSMGCQAIRAEEYAKFQQLLAEAPASQRNISYNLVDGRTMKAPDASGNVSFERAPYDPLNFANEMNAAGYTEWRGLHLGAQGRGMSAGLVGGNAFYHLDGDFSLAAIGDGDGPGIIQTPVQLPPWRRPRS